MHSGAGLCRDIDLNQLLQRFSKITLVDLHQPDLVRGIENQNLSVGSSIELIGGLDIGGVQSELDRFRRQADPVDLESLLNRAGGYEPDRLGTYDVIASTCLLSQLLCHASECIGESHPRFVETLQTIRRRHIEIMVEHLRPNGTGLLVTDFVSSISLPDLLTTTDLKATVRKAIEQGNFLHGLNPAMVGRVFEESSVREALRSVKITDPWRWAMPERIYACFAVVFQRLERTA